jgi:hypothetical protein
MDIKVYHALGKWLKNSGIVKLDQNSSFQGFNRWKDKVDTGLEAQGISSEHVSAKWVK